MKIGIDFQSLEDISNIIWSIKKICNLEKIHERTFIFSNDEDSYIFHRNAQNTPSDIIRNCDIKLRAFHNFDGWENFKGYDRLIQSQLVENYHTTNSKIIEFLDLGNVCLSSATISFEHSNFYYEPLFNLNFFYYYYGYNYLNYYKFNTNKNNLVGMYFKEGGKSWRDDMFKVVKKSLKDDFNTYISKDYNPKKLFEPYSEITFNLWGTNHINSYIDYKTSTCNLVFETLQKDANNEVGNKMYGRRYITEKTLKTILFSEENIFFIWYGPEDIYKYLTNIGIWFLNSEYYVDCIENSVYKTIDELKKMKEELADNNLVYESLLEKYGSKLENNVHIFNSLLEEYYKKDDIINFIKNGKRN